MAFRDGGNAFRIPPHITRAELIETLPAGAARNALDCAIWDLKAKETNSRVWQLAKLPKPQPVQTAFTLSLDTVENMTRAAAENAHRPILKLKVGTPDDLDRLVAVRDAAPDAKLVIDANEGWTIDDYHMLIDHLVDMDIAFIEQPFPAGQDACLSDLDRPIPICADESAHTSLDLPALVGKYDCVNIKLDKSGLWPWHLPYCLRLMRHLLILTVRYYYRKIAKRSQGINF